MHISAAEISMTKMGIHPAMPVLMSAKIMPKNAEIMPRNRAVIKISPHFSSLVFRLTMPRWIFFINSGTRIRPGMIPSVITQAMAEYTVGSVTVVAMETPSALAAEVAAGSS